MRSITYVHVLSDLIVTPRQFFSRVSVLTRKGLFSRRPFASVGTADWGMVPTARGVGDGGWRSGPRLFGEKAVQSSADRHPCSS
jgi:hypothetical protein